MGNALCCFGVCCVSKGANSAGRIIRSAANALPDTVQSRLKLSDSFLDMTIARLLYALLLFFGFISAIVWRNDWFGLWSALKIRDYYANACGTVFPSLKTISCAGDYMVHRITFACFFFFAVHAFLASPLFFVPPKIRLYIQYNGYCLKLPFLALVFLIALYVPDIFFQIYSWFCMIVSAIFIAIQMLLIMDWAMEWQENWMSRGSYDSLDIDEDASCFAGMTIWKWLMLTISIIFYVLGLILFISEIVLFATTSISCHLNRFIIIFTFLLGVAVSVLSVVTGNGVLPASIIFFFSLFSIFSALLSQPESECSRFHSNDGFNSGQTWFTYITAIGLIFIAAFSLIRTAIVTGLSASKLFQITAAKKEETLRDPYSEISDDESIFEQDVDVIKHQVSQMFWAQLVYCFASCFMSMILTNWDVGPSLPYKEALHEEWGKSDVSWVAVWMKVSGAWLMFFLFSWACVIPKIVTWRKFD